MLAMSSEQLAILPDNLEKLLASLELAAKTPAKQRRDKVSQTVDSICDNAFNHGLNNIALGRIVDVVSRKNELDQTSLTNLIKNLYPAQRVQNDTVLVIVSSLGQGGNKPSLATQVALVRWMIAVHDVLADRRILSRVYGVLFGLLDMMSLSMSFVIPHYEAAAREALQNTAAVSILHGRTLHEKLLTLGTRLEYARSFGNEPAVIGLLLVYKDYYPDIIVGTAGLGRASRVARPDTEWIKRVHFLQEANADQRKGWDETSQNGFKVLRNRSGAVKNGILPELHTYRAKEVSTTLEEISGVTELVDNLEQIELPSQLITVLRDPLFQKFLLLRNLNSGRNRLDLFLSSFLEEELINQKDGLEPTKLQSQILDGLLCHARFQKVLLPLAQSFLREYLPSWDGTSDDDSIVGLLSYLSLCSFAELKHSYLEPAERAILNKSPRAVGQLLSLYTQLTQRWGNSVSKDASPPTTTAAEDILHSWTSLIEHASHFMLTMLIVGTDEGLTSSAILAYFELVSSMCRASNAPGSNTLPVVLPPASIAYYFMQSRHLSDVARFGGILTTYKRAFEERPNTAAKYSKEYLDRFNSYLMDICNLFWRSRAFVASDAGASTALCADAVVASLQSYLEQVDRDYSLSSLFSLSHNHMLCALSIAAFRRLENQAENRGQQLQVRQAGPVTAQSLADLDRQGGLQLAWKEYRVEVLGWLEARGLEGIKELMYATMKDLMKGKS